MEIEHKSPKRIKFSNLNQSNFCDWLNLPKDIWFMILMFIPEYCIVLPTLCKTFKNIMPQFDEMLIKSKRWDWLIACSKKKESNILLFANDIKKQIKFLKEIFSITIWLDRHSHSEISLQTFIPSRIWILSKTMLTTDIIIPLYPRNWYIFLKIIAMAYIQVHSFEKVILPKLRNYIQFVNDEKRNYILHMNDTIPDYIYPYYTIDQKLTLWGIFCMLTKDRYPLYLMLEKIKNEW